MSHFNKHVNFLTVENYDSWLGDYLFWHALWVMKLIITATIVSLGYLLYAFGYSIFVHVGAPRNEFALWHGLILWVLVIASSMLREAMFSTQGSVENNYYDVGHDSLHFFELFPGPGLRRLGVQLLCFYVSHRKELKEYRTKMKIQKENEKIEKTEKTQDNKNC